MGFGSVYMLIWYLSNWVFDDYIKFENWNSDLDRDVIVEYRLCLIVLNDKICEGLLISYCMKSIWLIWDFSVYWDWYFLKVLAYGFMVDRWVMIFWGLCSGEVFDEEGKAMKKE